MSQPNPYVVLGVPFGTPRSACSAAFARRAKQLKKNPDAAFAITDLTWALNQIDDVIDDPEQTLSLYRIPADPGAFDQADAAGVLRPPPERLERRSNTSEADVALLLVDVSVATRRATAIAYGESRRIPSY